MGLRRIALRCDLEAKVPPHQTILKEMARALDENFQAIGFMLDSLAKETRRAHRVKRLDVTGVGTTETAVWHGLGKVPEGRWVIYDTHNNLRETKAPDEENLYLVASATGGAATILVIAGGD